MADVAGPRAADDRSAVQPTNERRIKEAVRLAEPGHAVGIACECSSGSGDEGTVFSY